MTKKKIILLTFLLPLLGVLASAVFFAVGSPEQAEHITWGATFSHSQAQDLGLDWKEAYLALLDEANVRRFRIPVYWDELEAEKGSFDFSSWDWQLEELDKRNGKAFLAIGMKLPRWPECRMPEWASRLPKAEREQEILRMLGEVVNRYKDHPAVWGWQIENEPFLSFGICPEERADEEFLDKEIALVRQLDPSRPIILTDTGEHSLWFKAGRKADVFSSTLFRVIYDPTIGFVRYPYPSVMYHRKAMLLKLWNPDAKVIIGELQAEPWVVKPPISRISLEEQYQTMSPNQLRETIEYAKSTGLDEFYLWGSEWWVWTRDKDDAIWNIIEDLFAE